MLVELPRQEHYARLDYEVYYRDGGSEVTSW